MKPIVDRLSPSALSRLGQVMEIASVPGLAIALIQDGAIIWNESFGLKNSETSDLVDPDTLFQVGSLSKPVFAYAVLRLVDQGRLDLDRPLVEYFPAPDLPQDPRSAFITARHVLSHSSGLQNWRFTKADLLEIKFDPGTQFAYSGEGYFFLQQVIEKITAMPIQAFLDQEVLQPLGMRKSTYQWSAGSADNIAWGHDERQPIESYSARMGKRMLAVAEKWGLPLEKWYYADIVRALPEIHANLEELPNNLIPNVAGSLLSTTAEFASFITQVLFRAGGEKTRLSEASWLLMQSPAVVINSAISWGLGWGIEHYDSTTCLWHWGDSGIFQGFTIAHIPSQSGLVILTNSSRGLKVCQWIFAQSAGRQGYPFLWL
jgi:CubicO group peptidase (beta-lactamase class C family)